MRLLDARLIAILVAAAQSLPLGAAHGTAEANELEVEILRDEANEFNDARGGYDVTQVFIGEAHDHTLAHGADGDTVYWRAELYGAPGGESPLSSGEWRAVFTFEGPAGPVVRSIRTTDGKSFQTDFDKLIANASEGALHVERAMILLSSVGLAPGSELKQFRVETFVGNELRDRAPGGMPIGGPVEVPTESRSLADAYALTGPTRYASARIEPATEGARLHVTSLLTKGSQHIHLHLPADVGSPDPTSVSVAPNGEATFLLRLPEELVEPLAFDLTTDVGGRITLVLDGAGLRAEGAPPATKNLPEEDGRPVPGPPVALLVLVATLAAVTLARRR